MCGALSSTWASSATTRVTYVAGPAASWARGRALAGAAGGRRTSWSCGCAGSTRDDGAHHAHRFPGGAADRRDENATAVLAYNDALAIGIVKGLKQLGLHGCPTRSA